MIHANDGRFLRLRRLGSTLCHFLLYVAFLSMHGIQGYLHGRA